MKKIINLNITIMICLVVVGCAIQPITATANSISLEYNSKVNSTQSAVQMANEHCKKYGKTAELRTRTIAPDDENVTDIFDCK